MNGFRPSKWLNNFIWPIDGTPTGTTTLGQSWPGSNSKALGLVPSSVISMALIRSRGLPICSDVAGIFYDWSENRLGLVNLFNGISDFSGLFNAKIWFTCLVYLLNNIPTLWVKFYHTTCVSTCDNLSLSATNQGWCHSLDGGIYQLCGLFNDDMWFICKCLIAIQTIFSIFNSIFL